MPSKANVISGRPKVSGGLYKAPLGTPLPTDATTPLADAFTEGGYIGEDGVTMNIDRNTEKIRAWGGSVVKVIQTEYGVTLNWEFLEFSADVLKSVFGEQNVSETDGAITVRINDQTLPSEVIVLEIEDGDDWIRVVAPEGQLGTEGGEYTFVHTDVIRFPVTCEALKDDQSGDNVLMYKAKRPAVTDAPSEPAA